MLLTLNNEEPSEPTIIALISIRLNNILLIWSCCTLLEVTGLERIST